jgi:hypothetical protein
MAKTSWLTTYLLDSKIWTFGFGMFTVFEFNFLFPSLKKNYRLFKKRQKDL